MSPFYEQCSAARRGSRGSFVMPATGGDDGFTLVEIMVVLMIMAILLATAVPTFMGATGAANDRADQSNLNTALTALKSQASQRGQTYSGLTPTIMSASEPSLSWSQSTPSATTTVSVQGPVDFYVSADGNGIAVVSYSGVTASCWWVVDNLQPVIDTVGPYGPNLQAAGGGPTRAPTGAGTFYGESTAPAGGGCDPAIPPTGAKNWASSLSAVT